MQQAAAGLRLLCAAVYVAWSVPLIALAQAPSMLRLLLGLPSLFLAFVCVLPGVDYLRLGVDRDGSRVIEHVNTKSCLTWNIVGTLLSVVKGDFDEMEGLALWPCVFIKGRVEMNDGVVDDTTAHERIHLAQAAECGVLPFYALYVCESLARILLGDGVDGYYIRISFEREAYSHESDPAYLPARQPFAWWPLLRQGADEWVSNMDEATKKYLARLIENGAPLTPQQRQAAEVSGLALGGSGSSDGSGSDDDDDETRAQMKNDHTGSGKTAAPPLPVLLTMVLAVAILFLCWPLLVPAALLVLGLQWIMRG